MGLLIGRPNLPLFGSRATDLHAELLWRLIKGSDVLRLPFAVFGILVLMAASAGGSEEIQLPPEVTPALRAACEADVRRLCIVPSSTIQSVKQCVMSKFMRLGRRCQMEIASAGLAN